MNSRRLMAFSTAEATPYHIVEKSGVVHHTKLGRSRRFRVIHDWSDPAAGPAMSVVPPKAVVKSGQWPVPI